MNSDIIQILFITIYPKYSQFVCILNYVVYATGYKFEMKSNYHAQTIQLANISIN